MVSRQVVAYFRIWKKWSQDHQGAKGGWLSGCDERALGLGTRLLEVALRHDLRVRRVLRGYVLLLLGGDAGTLLNKKLWDSSRVVGILTHR